MFANKLRRSLFLNSSDYCGICFREGEEVVETGSGGARKGAPRGYGDAGSARFRAAQQGYREKYQ